MITSDLNQLLISVYDLNLSTPNIYLDFFLKLCILLILFKIYKVYITKKYL